MSRVGVLEAQGHGFPVNSWTQTRIIERQGLPDLLAVYVLFRHFFYDFSRQAFAFNPFYYKVN